MRNLSLYSVLILLAFLASSCGSQKKATEAALASKSEKEYTYLFSEAGKAFMFGNVKQATEMYSNCVQLNPKSAVSYYYLSRIFAEDNQRESAYTFALKATSLQPENTWYALQAAQSAFDLERFGETEKILQNLTKSHPSNEFFYDRLVDFYSQMTDFQRLLQTYERMNRAFGSDLNRNLSAYDINMKIGNFPKAGEILEQIVKENPGALKYKALLAEFYLSIGKNEKAEILYTELRKQDNENPYVCLSYAGFAKFKHDTVGFVSAVRKVVDSEELVLEDKIKLCATGFDSGMISDELYEEFLNVLIENNSDSELPNLLYADYLLGKDSKHEALENLRAAAEINKTDLNLIISIFELEFELGLYREMYDDADQYSEIYVNNAKVFLYKGIAAYKIHKNKEAVEALLYGADLAFDDTQLSEQFQTYLAETYLALHNYDFADRYFEKVLSANPLNCLVAGSYARALAYRKHSLDKAQEKAVFCANLYPDEAGFIATRALVFFQKGEKFKAQELISKAFTMNPDDMCVLEIQGDILFQTGHADAAVQKWELSKEAGNSSERLKHKIKKKSYCYE